MSTREEIEAMLREMEENGTKRSAPGRYRLLKERLARIPAGPAADKEVATVRDAAGEAMKMDFVNQVQAWSGEVDDDVARGQREWRKKYAAFEFNKQAQAKRARLADAATDLLKACKAVLECTDASGRIFIPANGETINGLRKAIAKAEGREP